MKNIKNIIPLALLVLIAQSICAQKSDGVVFENSKKNTFVKVENVLIPQKQDNSQTKPVQSYHYDMNTLNKLELIDSKFIALDVSSPNPNEDKWVLDLIEVKSSFYDYEVTINNEEPYLGSLNKRKHYRGVVRGEENSSVVAISLFEGKMMGVISKKDIGNYNIVHLEKEGVHIIYNDEGLIAKNSALCGTETSEISYNSNLLKTSTKNKSSNGDCVELEFTTEYDIYTAKGNSVPNVVDYVEGLFNAVATLYQNENIEVALSHMVVWSTTDPYTLSGSALLDEYQDETSSVDGDLSMLLTTRIEGGVAAGGGLICNSDVDLTLAVSGVESTYSSFPSYSMSVHSITHEFGHLLGSGHTSECIWNGNSTAIDGCWGIQGTCSNPGVPSGGGTIMSYCHLESVGVNFALGFGTQPGNIIRNTVASASCVNPCCIPNRNMTIDVISGNNFDFEASNQITAVNTIFNGAIVDYDAGYEVVLQPGFEAEYGSEFYAFIDGCGGVERLGGISENNEIENLNFSSNGLNIYPNPSTDGVFNIELLENFDGVYIEVVNLVGKIIYTSQVAVNTKITFDITEQPKGIYLVRITNGDKNITQKIIYN